MFSQRLQDDAEKVDQDFGRLYRNVMKEYQYSATERSGHRYFLMLWSMVAPKGNIYRRNGLFAEHRKHSDDLWRQLYELADRHCDLLGGQGLPQEERADRLHKALTETKVEGRVMPDVGKPFVKDEELPAQMAIGFMPMEEFLREKVRRVGPFVLDRPREDREGEWKHITMGAGVFLLQVIAPFLIFLNRWNSKSNYLRSWSALRSHTSFEQLTCAGSSLSQVLTTIMGVLLLATIIFMVHCYVKEELDHAHKSSRLPTDCAWFLSGVFANAWGCCLIVLNIPLLFWSEPTPTNVVLDSMTLLFLFKLDDLSDILCSYLNMTDEDFQRLAAWNTALLSQCPVHVEDLVREDARSLQELWHIRYDETGRLCRARGGYAELRLSHRFAEQPSESTPMVAGGDKHHAGSRIMYRPSREETYILPTWLAQVLVAMWTILSWWLTLAQFAIPVFWYAINKKCK